MKVVQITTDNRDPYKDYQAPHPYFGAAPEALLQGFAALPEVEVHVISCVRQPVPAPDKLADNIYYHAVVVPKSGWMSSLYQGTTRACRALIAKIRPDIVHGQGTEREAAMAAIYSGYPNVLTIHGNMAELYRLGLAGQGLYGFLAARLESHALKRTAGVFCNSAYTEGLVAPRARRTWRVANAVRAAFFDEPETKQQHSGAVELINIGVVSERKRQCEILNLVKQFADAGYKPCMNFIGSLSAQNPYAFRFRDQVNEAEQQGYARYLGVLELPELIAEMDRSHACVHFPSEEAFGLVVAEALARGLRFFGADLGGISDICADVPGAELFTDFAGLQQGLTAWFEVGCPSAPAAPAIMRDRYHPEIIARQHLRIYNEVLSNH